MRNEHAVFRACNLLLDLVRARISVTCSFRIRRMPILPLEQARSGKRTDGSIPCKANRGKIRGIAERENGIMETAIPFALVIIVLILIAIGDSFDL